MEKSVFRETVLLADDLAARTERLEIIAPLMCLKKALMLLPAPPEKAVEEFSPLFAAFQEKSKEYGWNQELPSLFRRMLFLVCLSDAQVAPDAEPGALRRVCVRKASCIRLTREWEGLMASVWVHYNEELQAAEEAACNVMRAMLEEQFSSWLQLFNCANKGMSIQQQNAYMEMLETVRDQFVFPQKFAQQMDEMTVRKTMMREKIKNFCLPVEDS